MGLDSFLNQTFGHTTIDQKGLKDFIREDPCYYGWSIDKGLSESDRDIFSHLDYFEFHYRRYLLGYPKTMHRVFFEIRRFVESHPQEAAYYVNYVFEGVKNELLSKEWYEMVERLTRSSVRIKALLPEVDKKATPLALFALKVSYPGHDKMRSGDKHD